MLKGIILIVVGLGLTFGGICFLLGAKSLKDKIMYQNNSRNEDLPGPVLKSFYLIFCVTVAFLDLGDSWYEWVIKILAFLFALTFAFNIYSFVTDVVSNSNFIFKRYLHLLLLIISPVIIYLAVKIYFL